MASELETLAGFHKVDNVKARELLQPYVHTDGYYLLRPSKGDVLCTICVTNKNKLMNYRLVHDRKTGHFYIHNHTTFPSINLLLGHYRAAPINAEVNTRLLFPVTPPGQATPTNDGEDAYVIMERQTPLSPDRNTDIPGLHTFLPKSEIGSMMQPVIGTNGYYLLRPSSTSEGQLTLAVSHAGKVLNFKINCEKKQYFISPKKMFPSVKSLLHHYQTNPIRSKRCGNEKIYLLYPIPVDHEREKVYQEIQQQKAVAKQELVVSNELPPGWAEHFHLQYKRCYYYNEQTGQSVWERPKAPPPTKSPPPLPGKDKVSNRGRRMTNRPLPSVPMAGNTENTNYEPVDTPTNIVRRESSKKRGRGRVQQPLPAVPDQGDIKQNGYHSNTLPLRRSSNSSERDLPPLPPKEDTPVIRRGLPPLPPKEDTPVVRRDQPSKQAIPPGVPTRGGSSAPGNVNRPPIRIPTPELSSRGESSQDKVQRSLPPLPPKEDIPVRKGSIKPRPKPPPKATPSIQNGLPPLPPKEDSKPLPPLPPKTDEKTSPLQPPLKPSSQAKPKRKRVVEYEDTVLLHQADSKPQPNMPPLPEKEPPQPSVAVSGGDPPPPPPPPPVGVPMPPPPPPSAPPPPSPLVGKSRGPSHSVSTPSPQGSPSAGGRPFTAIDLASQRTMLKKREAERKDRRNTAPSGIAGVFANAIDTRITSIRKAMVDSDSEESDFEDVEDDDWD